MCSRFALASMSRLRRRYTSSQRNTSPVQFGQALSISPPTALRFGHFLELEARLTVAKRPGCWETVRPNTSRFSSHLCSILRWGKNPLRAKRLSDASFSKFVTGGVLHGFHIGEIEKRYALAGSTPLQASATMTISRRPVRPFPGTGGAAYRSEAA